MPPELRSQLKVLESIDAIASDPGSVTLPEAVVTHLYKWNSDALSKFLDLRRGKFEYALKRPGRLTLVIARFGQKIQVICYSS